jgi:hypothetical protein
VNLHIGPYVPSTDVVFQRNNPGSASEQIESLLLSPAFPRHRLAMALHGNPVTPSADQIADLNRNLSKMRHDINNCLAAMTLAAELTRLKPETAGEMMTRLLQQLPKIKEEVTTFSTEFERTFGISRL